MYFLYSLLLTIGFTILLPRFALDALRSGKYVTGLGQRLGNIPALDSIGKPVIWIHCVSVGEVQAAQSIVRSLATRFPKFAIVLSTTTVTGQKVAREIFGDQTEAVFYFPIDWAWTVRRVLSKVQPAAILVMETELWPRLFREARRTEVPVAILNGRISEKSFGRYKLVRPFIRRVLNDLTLALMQTERDAERIGELGMPKNRTVVSGNLKFDSAAGNSHEQLANEIRDRFGFQDGRPLIVAASTHQPEEQVLMDALIKVRQTHPNARLLIAPRHPERFDGVADILSKSDLSFVRRSAAPSEQDSRAEVVLLDSIGELRAAYPPADLAFVGGSIAPHGGHSVIEPGTHGVCTITGPHTQNFAAVTKALLDEDALIQLRETDEPATDLAQVFVQLLSDETKRRAIGERAKVVCDRNRGATERTLEMVSHLLSGTRGVSDEALPFPPLHAATAK